MENLTCTRLMVNKDIEKASIKLYPAEYDDRGKLFVSIGFSCEDEGTVYYDFTVGELVEFSRAVMELATHAKAVRNNEIIAENIIRKYSGKSIEDNKED